MLNEQQLLAALRCRDPTAFNQLFEMYSDKIYRLEVGLLENEAEAEEVVQDAFMRLFERLDQFEGRSKLSIQLRHRLQSTKGINSFTDLLAHIEENPFTLIQFFAPM